MSRTPPWVGMSWPNQVRCRRSEIRLLNSIFRDDRREMGLAGKLWWLFDDIRYLITGKGMRQPLKKPKSK